MHLVLKSAATIPPLIRIYPPSVYHRRGVTTWLGSSSIKVHPSSRFRMQCGLATVFPKSSLSSHPDTTSARKRSIIIINGHQPQNFFSQLPLEAKREPIIQLTEMWINKLPPPRRQQCHDGSSSGRSKQRLPLPLPLPISPLFCIGGVKMEAARVRAKRREGRT